MTVAWQNIQDGLPAILSSISGVAVPDITWMEVTNTWANPIRIKLKVLGGLRALGVDERRMSYDVGTDENTERVYGGRVITISIMCETQDQDLADSGYALADKIRTRLRRTDVLHRLREEACLGLSEVLAIRLEDYTDAHDRQRSLAILDVSFLAHVSDLGTDLGYFDRVVAEDTIENSDGTTNTVTLDTDWDLS